jgi:hypothetical protein
MPFMHGERLKGRIFYKSPSFAGQATELGAWEQIDNLKKRLESDATVGDVIKGSGSLRKVRIPLPGRGARGGGRVIYYQIVEPSVVLFLAVYAKSDKEDLDNDDINALVRLRRLMCRQLDLPV